MSATGAARARALKATNGVLPFPRERLLEMARRLYFTEQDARVLLEAVAAYDDAARQVTISQHAATVTQLAHEWAEARRARLSLGPVRLEPCITEPNEGTCVDGLRYGTLISPCEACEVTLERMGEKKRHTAKLSGLSARLERACLGPRPKKEEPTC